MKAITYTETDKVNARLGGFKVSKPKKPKSKTEKSLNSYISKYNIWVGKLKTAAKKGKVKADKKENLDKLKAKVSGL